MIARILLVSMAMGWWPPHRGSACRLLLLALVVSFMAIFAYRAVVKSEVYFVNQMRLFLPVAGAGAGLFAYGLLQATRTIRAQWLSATFAVGLGSLAAITPFAYILPAYPSPLPVWRGTTPPLIPHEVSVRIGNATALLGYRAINAVVSGEYVRLTLYWQSLGPPGQMAFIGEVRVGPSH
ncbi:MAG: hypothetical protein HY675_26550 [Chloroflexi bacterium]|nr:hypothetical protein [Chloroflexota bacterium]